MWTGDVSCVRPMSLLLHSVPSARLPDLSILTTSILTPLRTAKYTVLMSTLTVTSTLLTLLWLLLGVLLMRLLWMCGIVPTLARCKSHSGCALTIRRVAQPPPVH